jgi:hypothetical protein
MKSNYWESFECNIYNDKNPFPLIVQARQCSVERHHLCFPNYPNPLKYEHFGHSKPREGDLV